LEKGNEEGEYQSSKDGEEPKYSPPVPDSSEDATKYGTESLFVEMIRKGCATLKRNFTGPSTREI
jgi:hypothetical protein